MNYQNCDDCIYKQGCEYSLKYRGMCAHISLFTKKDNALFDVSFFCRSFKRRYQDEKKDH